MARPRSIDPELVTKAQNAVAQARDLHELKAAQAVLLPALFGASLSDTATALGVGRATVARLQTRFREPKSGRQRRKPRNWGGRRNALLSVEEEEEFLRPWLEHAEKGGVLVVSPLRQALAEKLGEPVKPSVVYRLLARHGWRKVAPDTSHPQSDPDAQAEWKKNSRKRWRRC